MVAWIGRWLLAVGLIHLSFGLVFMHDTLGLLWSEGLWNTVNGQPVREAVFWFFCTGIVLLIVGALVHQAEAEQPPGRLGVNGNHGVKG